MNLLRNLGLFWNNSEFMSGVKHKFYSLICLNTVATVPDTGHIKNIILHVTKINIIEDFQILSLFLSILVSLSILFKFIKSFKKKENDK